MRFGLSNAREDVMERDIGVSIRAVCGTDDIIIRTTFDNKPYLCRDTDEMILFLLDIVEKFKKEKDKCLKFKNHQVN